MFGGVLLAECNAKKPGRCIDGQFGRSHFALLGGVIVFAGLRGSDDEHNEIVGSGTRFLTDLRRGLGKLALDALEVFEDASATLGDEHGLDVVTFFAREFADAGSANGDNREIFVNGKLFEIVGTETLAHVGERGQTKVRLVDPVLPDGIVVIHARKGCLDLVASCLESRGEKAFNGFPDALGLRIGHLEIDLRELGLAVGAQVFVAEASDDLKILIKAGNHQDLFEELRRLRQSVEGSGLNTAWNKVVARALRRGAGHEGRFDFEKALGSKIVADGEGNFVTQFYVELHGIAAQVDVAILQAHLFVGQGSIARKERRVLGFVEDAEFIGDKFDLAGGDVLVDGIGVAQLDGTNDSDDVLVAQQFGFLVEGSIALAAEDDLGDARAVADVDEDDGAEVAAAVDPSHEHGLFAGIGGAESPAHMCTSQVA